MAFMISRETENVKSSEEIESAFRALSSEGKPYVTKEELYQVRLGKGKISWAQLMLKGALHIDSEAGRTGLVQLLTSGHWRSALVDLTVPSPLQNLTREQADYCVSHMKPYVDGKGRELPTAFDYVEFTRSLFVN